MLVLVPTIPAAYSQVHSSQLSISNIVQTTTGPTSATVTYSATVLVDGSSVTPSCTPSSGSSFASGSNLVTCSFQDASGATVSLKFYIWVDTISPTINSIITSDALITDSDAGGPAFNAIVTFSETMDTTVAPSISFSPSVSGSLSFTSGTWSSGNTVYTASYSVADANVELTDIDVSVSGAKDAFGNTQSPSPASTVDLFNIDTLNPVVSASPPGSVYNSAQSVTLEASEPGTIYFTTDGSTPTTSSTPYVGSPISINVNTELKFIAKDAAGNIGAVTTETYTTTGTSTESATGLGIVSFSTDAGSFASINSIAESTLPESGKPTGMTFDYGFFMWNVTGLNEGQSINVTMTFPAEIPSNTQYWTVIAGSWINLTPLLSGNDGDNVLVLTITDGGMGDEDGSVNGQISDPGGSATVVDATPPAITAPQDITQEATGPLSTLATLGTPTVSDDIDPSPTVTNDAPSGGFPVGNTTVTWTATDDAGNSATATQTVTIADTTAPTITAPAEINQEATGVLTNITLGSPIFNDIADPSPTVTNNAPSGGFPVGNTTVIWNATDTSGNSATATQVVTITDTTPPSITAPDNVIQEATAEFTTVILGLPTVSDLVDGSPTVTNDAPVDGFPVGIAIVTWTATDASGNNATATQTVTLTDTTPPTITAPADITTEATGPLTTVSLGTPSISDLVDSTPTVTNDAPLDGFPVGNTTVIWNATDASGNSAIDTQLVTITDTTAPSIAAPPDISTAATGEFTQVALGSPIVSDTADPSVNVTNDAPSGGFPVGTTTVTWNATDASGNTASDAQIVTVTDTGAPSITAPIEVIQEATAPLTSVDLGVPVVSDEEDPSPTVTNDAPAGGFPVGTTIVTWTATDASGNNATDTQTVTITDTTPPSITAPADISTEATGLLTNVTLGTPAVSDIADPSPTVTNDASLDGFPVGTTIVTWNVTDSSGNSATTAQTVTITDTSAPTITAPDDIIQEATATLTTVSLGIPTVSDTADPNVNVTNNAPAEGFPVGNTTVTWTATDDSGNSAIATQTVTITDTTDPTITAPADVTAEATGLLTSVSLGTPSASDIADPSPTVTNNAPAEGFPVGTTIVTWTATDASGNSANATQTVTVTDTTAPSITAPADITQEASGEFTTVTLGTPDVSDAVDDSPAITNNAPSGGFSIGTTIVTWTATDASGNNATDTQTVTITDTTPPSITAPADISTEATGVLTNVTLGSPTFSDIADPSPTVTNNAPADGFPVGTTIVTWTATDDSGNNSTDTQTVTITDTGAPSITAPADISTEATGVLTTVDLGEPTVIDDEDPSPAITNDAPSGGFPVGTTTVTWNATDASGNSATATQTVTIIDTTPPSITAPADISTEATGVLTNITLGSPTFSDIADPSPTVTNDAPLDGFPVGNTTVIWTATDASGNSANATQTVSIVDTTAPSITAPADISTEATGVLTTVALGIPTVTDLVDSSPTVTNNAPPGGFPVGNTTVTWTATDSSGNNATDTQVVTITDTTAPSIIAPEDISTIATGELTPVILGSPTVSDIVDPSPTITNDAPIDGFPVGTTIVTWTATDASGNSATDTQSVTVTDNSTPSITAPADVTMEATAPLTSVILGSPTVSDNEDPSPDITNDAPVDGFPVGNTTVTWIATDDSGNSANATQLVTITDTTAPTITSPADITQEASSEFTPVTLGIPDVSDTTDDSPTVTNNAPSGGFPVGTTSVVWTATDASGNSANATQTVTVTDTTAPSITAPADISTEATGVLTNVTLGSPTVDDLVDSDPTVANNAPAEGFPVGNTTVTWTSTDSSGNNATDTQTVTITDTTAPTITSPADISTEATGVLTNVTLGTPAVSDLVDSSPTVTNNAPVDGFPVGNTTVTWTATDDADNNATDTQVVTITDTTPPSITAPADVTAEATGSLTSVTLGSPLASDIADPSLTVTNDAPGGGFPVGNTTVTWNATDASGNSATATQVVTVTDTTPPSITAPADISTEATGEFTSVTLGSPTVSDLVDSSPNITNDAPSGGFTVGTTTVTWTATDDSGNSATDSQAVTITDTGAPSITAPADITQEATAPLTPVTLGTPIVSDDEDPSPTVTHDAPVDGFPVGITIVTWTATDNSGNSATATQSVAVTDTTPPSITAPADIAAEATSVLSSIALGSASASDVADPSPTVTNDAPSGGFPVGTTIVNWTAIDSAGNSATATQVVTVTDTTAPSITAPAEVSTEATGQFTLVDLGSASAIDIADPSPTVTNNAPSGGFPVGNTTVTWTATDDSGNNATATQTVTIVDTTAPSITAPADISTEATDTLTTVDLGIPTVTDLADPSPTVTNNAPSGGFPVGNTTVIWTATDDSGNSATDTQTVTITDTGAPSITAPADITQEATGQLTLVDLGSPVVSDDEDPSPTVTNDAPTGGFPVGTTIVTWTATDDSGNSATATQLVTITDTTAPSIASPADITQEAISEFSSVTLGSPIVSDLADQSPTLTNDAPAGGFPVGTTTVTWTATDDAGNSASATQAVTITDTTAPSITVPADITEEATAPLTPVSLGTPTASDVADPTLTVTNDAPVDGFPVGTTVVTWTATDDSGNSATATQTVIITDTTAPSITAPADISTDATGPLTTIDLGVPSISDLADPSPAVTNDAPAGGFPVGTTIVTWTATDDSGNSAADTQTVTVTDTGAPSITAPPDITQEAAGELTTVDLGSPIVSDDEDPSPTVTNDAPSGGFSVGTTIVTWTATDDSGNSASATQTVTITDTIPPIVTAAPAGGTYDSAQDVTLTSSDLASPTVTIYYTTNGDTPTTASSEYSGTPIAITVDTTLKFFGVDSSGNSGTVVTETFVLTGTAVDSATGTGQILLSTSEGSFQSVSAIPESSLPTEDKPTGLTFEHGFVSFHITGITPGGSVTLTLTYPSDIPANSQYWTVIDGEWTELTSQLSSNDGDNVLAITITDGGLGDEDGAVNGEISDPSGSGYVPDSTPPVITASPIGGVYSSSQSVMLSSNEAGTQMYYTTDGSTPTTASPQYTGVPISVSSDTTLKFFGIDPYGNESPVSTEVYDINIVTEPVIVMEDLTTDSGRSIFSGRPVYAEYVGPSSVLVGKQIDSITVYVKKSSSSATGPLAEVGIINTDLSMKKVFATLDISTLTTGYDPHEFTLPSGESYLIEAGDRIGVKYTGGTSSSNYIAIMRDLTSSDPFDGSNAYLTFYESSWTSQTSYDLKMILKYSGGASGGSDTTPPTVWASPAGGSYNTDQLVTLTPDEPATIYYTLDGSTPTTSSTIYAGSPLSVSTATTIKFFGVDPSDNAGTVQTETYTFDTTPPAVTATPAGGSYDDVLDVELDSNEGGTTIYYTTDGTDPGPSSSVYTSPIQLSSSTILKFYGVDAAGNVGSTVTETYTITIPDTTPPTVTASPEGGTFGPSGASVELFANEPATIYYTTDGSTPDDTSDTYSTPILITADTTLQYFAIDTAGNPSAVQTQTYTIDNVPPTVTASPLGGTYTSSQSVELSANEPATIYYTTDGNDPTVSSPEYTGPISITADTTLKFYGTDSYGNAGTIVTEIYDIDAPAQPAGIIMETGSTTGQSVWSGRQVHAEFVGPSSSLVGKYVDSITVMMKKVGSTPPGTAEIGIINTDLSMKKVFATVTPSELSTSYTYYEYSLPSGDAYLIEAGDRIGIKYSAGTSSTYIAIQRDTTGSFDGANSYHTTYTSGWNTFTSVDLTMVLEYSGGGTGGGGSSDTTPPTVSASPTGGTYTSSQSVELSANEPATIYYTTDGNDPTVSSPEYTGPISITADTTLKFYGIDTAGNPSSVVTEVYDIETVGGGGTGQEPGIVMEDTTTDTGRSIMSTRPVYAEYVGSDSVLVGKYIDSITVNLKKSSSATGTAYVGIINTDLSMKKVFAELDVSILPTGPYDPIEFMLPSGDDYLIEAGDRIGVYYAGTGSQYIAIMRDLTPSDPFDGTSTHLTYYEGGWVTSGQTSYDLTMTLKLID